MRALLTLLLAGSAVAEGPILLIPLEGERRDVRAAESRVLKALKKAGHRARLSSRSMAELQAAAGCAEDAPQCLGMIGREAGVDEFVYGSVFREGRRELLMLLRRFSVLDEQEVGRAQVKMRRVSSRDVGKAVAEILKSPDAGKDVPDADFAATLGTLEVQADMSGVLIRVNGQPRGVAPLRLEEIGVATYDLEAEKAGYETWRGQAAVEAGKVTTVQVSMELLPQEQRALATAEPGILRPRTWIAGGAAAALLTGATVFAVLTVSQQNDFDEGIAQIDSGVENAGQLAGDLESDADSGESKALIANILFGAAGAAAIVTGVFVYMDLKHGTSGSGAVSVQPGGVQIRF